MPQLRGKSAAASIAGAWFTRRFYDVRKQTMERTISRDISLARSRNVPPVETIDRNARHFFPPKITRRRLGRWVDRDRYRMIFVYELNAIRRKIALAYDKYPTLIRNLKNIFYLIFI